MGGGGAHFSSEGTDAAMEDGLGDVLVFDALAGVWLLGWYSNFHCALWGAYFVQMRRRAGQGMRLPNLSFAAAGEKMGHLAFGVGSRMGYGNWPALPFV